MLTTIQIATCDVCGKEEKKVTHTPPCNATMIRPEGWSSEGRMAVGKNWVANDGCSFDRQANRRAVPRLVLRIVPVGLNDHAVIHVVTKSQLDRIAV